MSVSSTVTINLYSYSPELVGSTAALIVKCVRSCGGIVKGPIPMPHSIKRITLNTSPHANGSAKEQFQMGCYTRKLVVVGTPDTVSALASIDIPPGVDVKIKTSNN